MATELITQKKKTTAEKLNDIGEETIFARIADCEFIHNIAQSYGMSAGSLHAWLDARPEMYARARERQADKLVADMIQIADDGSNDTYIDDNGNQKTDQDVVARSRLRVEARKWLAGKMNAKRYGDKTTTEIIGDPSRPVSISMDSYKNLTPDELDVMIRVTERQLLEIDGTCEKVED